MARKFLENFAREIERSKPKMAATKELTEEQKSYIFSCIECRAILGDSWATFRTNLNLNSISLNGQCIYRLTSCTLRLFGTCMLENERAYFIISSGY